MLLLAALLLASAPPAAEPATPLRLTVAAFHGKAAAEVRDLPAGAADQALRRALQRIVELDRLTDPEDSSSAVARLNAASGKGPQKLDADLATVLERALGFCDWSEGIHGPLGGRLNEIWGLRGSPAGLPLPEALAAAAESAACNRLRLDPKNHTAALVAGSLIDLWGFAEGFAVDRAIDLLRAAGATNAWVQVGAVERGIGPGPQGDGWLVVPPRVPGSTIAIPSFALRDRAVALIGAEDRKLGIGGETWPPYIHQRSGKPAEGVRLVVAVTDLALDAQGLAVTMFAAGNRQGELRLGSIRPTPSILWLLGSGQGTPLTAEYHWSEIRHPR